MAVRGKHQLKEGTILDDRYVIQQVLGEGGFGITYAGINQRINVKVAIKEFFCRDYMERDCRESDQIQLIRESDRKILEQEKSKFLKEARIVGDFVDEAGVVDVTDYFEANGTAYIVMGYLDGVTLKEYVKGNGKFQPEEIFRMMVPLMETLGKIHSCGVIHRDISPDNIMMLRDKTLRLMDFGAARDFSSAVEKSYSIILKGGYTPREQYDSKGEQGPWTDVYALSATLYSCITGVAPDDALQRILHDELRTPSDLGILIDKNLEEILMRGLRLVPEERYQSMSEMMAAIEQALPEEKQEKKERHTKRMLAAGITAALSCVFLALGIWYIYEHQVELKFKGIRTETVILTPDEDMTTREFYDAAKVVEERIKVLTGKNNYIWNENDGVIEVVTPLDVYHKKDVEYVLKSYISRPIKLELYDTEGQERVALEREDIERVEIRHGEVKGANREELKLPEEGDYTYLELTLTKEKAEKLDSLREKLKTEGELIPIHQDSSMGSFYWLYAFSKGDGKTLNIVDMDQEENFMLLLQYNLTHQPFSQALSIQYERQAVWENASQSIIAGENQCNQDQIDGESMVIAYAPSSWDAEKKGKGDWYHVLAVFKARLDAFGVPYAFGVSYTDDRTIMIKTAAEDMWDIVAELLPEYGNISIEGKWEKISTYAADMSAKKLNDGTYGFTIQSPEYKTEEIYKTTQKMIERGEDKLYLTLGGYRLAECNLQAPIEDGKVVFKKLWIENKSQITEDMLPLINFLRMVQVEKDIPLNYRMDSVQFFTSDGKLVNAALGGDLPYRVDQDREEEIRELVQEMGGTCSWEYTVSGETLRLVFPQLEKDGFPGNGLDIVEQIYQKQSLGNGDFYDIHFYLYCDELHENGSVNVHFYKDSKKATMTVFGNTVQGNSADVTDKCKKYLENSGFYKSLTYSNEWEYAS